jgi:hypothetical protein
MSTSERKHHQATPSAPRPERAAAGEYGEGRPHQATGVGPRNPKTPEQKRNDRHGQPDEYGNAQLDDQLRELIRQRLTEDPLLDASDVRVEVHNGRVTLAGTATNTRSRAEIEQTVENCGVLEVDNQLRPLS